MRSNFRVECCTQKKPDSPSPNIPPLPPPSRIRHMTHHHHHRKRSQQHHNSEPLSSTILVIVTAALLWHPAPAFVLPGASFIAAVAEYGTPTTTVSTAGFCGGIGAVAASARRERRGRVALMSERRGLWPTRPPIDLRSDTVTVPTPGMRKAMHKAEVGDDVLGEDPTVKKLEAETAELLGKEAALFVPSGTMANLICHLVWCSQRGSEMILGDQSHSFLWEQANAAQFGGIGYRPLRNQPDGTIDLNQIEAAVRGNNPCFPVSRLVSIENTQAQCGGKVLPLEYLDDLGKLAQEEGLRVHMDGARLWNAAAASRQSPARIVDGVDSVAVCYSKGLGAPVGSAVAGSADFIRRAHRVRKALGGGMRQSGVVAAAALEGLRKQLPRLGDDHASARRLAQGLQDLGVPNAVGVDPDSVQSNVVLVNIGPDLTNSEAGMSASIVCDRLREKGVLAMATMPGIIRFVTHSQVSTQDIQRAVAMMKEVLEEAGFQGLGLRRHAPSPVASEEALGDSAATNTNSTSNDNNLDASTQLQQQQQQTPSATNTAAAAVAATTIITTSGAALTNKNLLSEGAIGARPEFADATVNVGAANTDASGVPVGTAAVTGSLRDGGGDGADPDPRFAQTPAVYDEELDGDPLGESGERSEEANKEEEEEASRYSHSFEEVQLQGMTVSSEGFVAVMASKDSGRALRLVMTPDDPMSGGLDVENAETSEARTLLQLMQGIDVARHLPSDALGSLMSIPMSSGVQLSTVCVVNAIPFSATLTAKIPQRDGETQGAPALFPSSPTSFPYTAASDPAPTPVSASGETAFELSAVAAAAAEGGVSGAGVAPNQTPLVEQNGVLPSPSSSVASTVTGIVEAAAAVAVAGGGGGVEGATGGGGGGGEGVMSGEAFPPGGGTGEGAATTAAPAGGAAGVSGGSVSGGQLALGRPRVGISKEAVSRSSFESFGLALRYPGTRIYVRKELLAPGGGIGDAAMTFDAVDVPELYPTLLKLEDARTRKSPADDMDAQFEVTRIRQQLESAMNAGDAERIATLREKLNALVVPDEDTANV